MHFERGSTTVSNNFCFQPALKALDDGIDNVVSSEELEVKVKKSTSVCIDYSVATYCSKLGKGGREN